MTEMLTAISSAATAVGVFIAAWQLWLAHKQSVISFEDSLAREYRDLVARLPAKALLGEELSEEEYRRSFDELFRYFDLSNEQAFLRLRGRVSDSTWQFWYDGIASNLKRPAFRRAWAEVCARPDAGFDELRALFPPAAGAKRGDGKSGAEAH